MSSIKKLSIDIETFSDIDIKNGVYRYTDTPNFEILLFAYAVDGGDVQLVDFAQGETLPQDIAEALDDPTVIKKAFNAQFERICINKDMYIPDGLDPSQWKCVMVHAIQLGLPGSLKQCAKVLNVDEQKDNSGTQLINFFSKPCKPTKANGMRTRNLPKHDLDKWELFKEYCKQDVKVEMAIEEKLSAFPVDESEWSLYSLDQRINDRGVGVDRELAESAVHMMDEAALRHMDKLKELTGLENPNSLKQFKEWLSDQGHVFPSLGKDLVKAAIKDGSVTGVVKQALELRLKLSMSSTKKYIMMDEATCEDGRIRGLLQFYGANRTGRWAGRLLQVQNLPRNKLEPLDLARNLVKQRDTEAIEWIYDSVPDTLKQLIRTGLVAKSDHTFFISDFSAIEARVLAWYADEKWAIEAFATHGKIYEATAAQMFKVELEDVDSDLRQKGKVATLACIAKGQRVLTDKGLVPIEKVTKKHMVWDGSNWVKHDGVISRGEKEVISYEGLTATTDHVVWCDIKGEYKSVPFGEAAACGYRLAKTGAGRRAIRLGQNHQSRETLGSELARPKSLGGMPGVWETKLGSFLQSKIREIERVSELFSKTFSPEMVGPALYSSQTTVHQSERFTIQTLWTAWDRISILFGIRSLSLYDRNKWNTRRQKVGDRPNRQRRPLREGESEMGHKKPAGSKSTETFDILNAGPLNRFTVEDSLVHNCGYQGSVGALKAMGALEQGLKEEELEGIIKDWRSANKNIVQFWYDTQRAAIDALDKRGIVKGPKGLKFFYKKGFLFIQLPSGRKLAYAKARLEEGTYGPQVVYEGKGDRVGFSKLNTYGGKLVENIVQATARDLLAEAMMRLDAAGFDIVFHVHDEAVAEVPKDSDKTIEEMNAIMSICPDWANGLPLGAEGFVTDYYKKD